MGTTARGWRQALEESLQALRQEQKDNRQAAEDYLIRPPSFKDDILEDFCRQLEEDNPDVHRTHQAVPRLTEPTVSLVLLHERGSKVFLNPNGTNPVSLGRRPKEMNRAFQPG
jgi:hypothetical protein